MNQQAHRAEEIATTQRYGVEEISRSLQDLIHSVLKRVEASMCCCPTMPPLELDAATVDLEKASNAVEESLTNFKVVTEERFNGFSDDEIILSAFLYASIWHNARSLATNSNHLGDLIGRDHLERLSKLLLRLSTGSSPVCRFAELRWDSRAEYAGCYRFRITKPATLQQLIFGTAVEMA